MLEVGGGETDLGAGLEIEHCVLGHVLDDVVAAQDAAVVHEGFGQQLELVQRVGVLARHHAQAVHEVAVEGQHHVVEQDRLESGQSGLRLLVAGGFDGLGQLAVGGDLLGDRLRRVVEFLFRVVLATEHCGLVLSVSFFTPLAAFKRPALRR